MENGATAAARSVTGAPTETSPAKAARAFNAGAAILSFSVLADSGLEHYRGSFRRPAMYIPLAISSLALASNAKAVIGSAPSRGGRRSIQWGGAIAGAAGVGFHVYNLGKRPGGLSWHNLFYAAPLGAPAALAVAAALGMAADRIGTAAATGEPRIAGLPAARVAATGIALGLAGATGEAWLLHFRGAFHNPAMLLPVAVPPVAALMLMRDATTRRASRYTRAILYMTAALGVIGAGFHARGVSRSMGGWRNWRQTLFAGPPLPAPLAFTGLAIAGLGVLALLRQRRG